MTKMLVAALLAIGLFIGILILLEVGRRFGGQRLARDPEGARVGTGAVDGAIFALVGLLMKWLRDGMKQDADAYIESLGRLLDGNTRFTFEHHPG